MRRIHYLFLLLLLPPNALAADYPARVIGISDGDTLTVLTADKKPVKIRLAGIDAPENGQDFASRAKQAAADLAFGKTVTVRAHDTDRYGRIIAKVILPDGRSMNAELVGQGLAWWYRTYAPNDSSLAALEAEAKAEQRGLWRQPNPTPPWEWRKGYGVPQTTGVAENRRSHIYHAPHCRSVAAMKETNRVIFETAEQAETSGYRSAKDCRPFRRGT